MSLDKILGNLTSDQMKELKDILDNNPESIIEFIQSKMSEEDKYVNKLLEKKQILQSDEKYKDLIQNPDLLEKNSVQMVNAERYLSDFGKVKEELKSLFNTSTSDNDEKDLTTKLYDRMTAIMLEYLILSGYSDIFCQSNDQDEYEAREDLVTHRLDELVNQYSLLGYLYGEQIGLKDNEIINKSFILSNYYPSSFFSDVLEKGESIEKIISDFYLDNKNTSNFLCVRDEYNLLFYPRFNAPFRLTDNSSLDKEFKDMYSTIEKYSPFTNDRVEQLYNEILKPYYERIGFDIYNNDNNVGTVSVIDGYESKFAEFNSVDFYNKYEFDLTQELVNEFLSQKNNKSNKQL